MKQLFQLTTQINTFSSENNAELVFLFDSLLLSLKTAAKHAGSQSILRATPSVKHAINLSKFLERTLLRIPVPGLHDHISDLFDYFQRTLEENCGVPVEEELDELVYSWGEPLDDFLSTYNPPVDPPILTFNAPYTISSPLPGNPTLDPTTGEVSYNANI